MMIINTSKYKGKRSRSGMETGMRVVATLPVSGVFCGHNIGD
jgi:hypothetical protein